MISLTALRFSALQQRLRCSNISRCNDGGGLTRPLRSRRFSSAGHVPAPQDTCMTSGSYSGLKFAPYKLGWQKSSLHAARHTADEQFWASLFSDCDTRRKSFTEQDQRCYHEDNASCLHLTRGTQSVCEVVALVLDLNGGLWTLYTSRRSCVYGNTLVM